ncbi:MAG: plasmid replication protein RepC [Rhizobium sp.]
MQTGSVTTPFGRRPMTLALVKRQLAEIKPGKSADKWKIFRDASAAMDKLGIQSNSLAVLDALLSFYPNNELRQDAQLIVFPSNIQLSLRAHQMAGATVRRHIAVLVEAGLIVRKDSANGKRYARKDGAGEIENAFGFDLSPLLARCEELAILAQQVMAERAAFRKAKENLTICRRDVRKLITAAMEEGADGDWEAIEQIYIGLVRRIPRSPSIGELADILDSMELLQTEVVNQLDMQQNSEIKSSSDAHNEQHIQNSNPESHHEFEPANEKTQEAKSRPDRQPTASGIKAFPLAMVLRACPTIVDYGPSGLIETWRDMMAAAVVVRSMLGISPSAYQQACDIMGPENAATSVACILERANFINSAGGYLRDLTRRSEQGEFSLGPMIMALLKVSGDGAKRTG